jgi:hypothetical protein
MPLREVVWVILAPFERLSCVAVVAVGKRNGFHMSMTARRMRELLRSPAMVGQAGRVIGITPSCERISAEITAGRLYGS